jgi:hypothetical protein
MTPSVSAPVPADVTAAIGFFLTLVGLIGTFFYVHLSNWLREILELQSKYELNRVGESDARKEGRLQCKFELKRLLNHVPALVSAVISIFIVLLLCDARILVNASVPPPAVIPYYKLAAKYFLVAYFGLTFYFLLHGYVVAFSLRRQLYPKASKPPAHNGDSK